jgi:hypothetical protein
MMGYTRITRKQFYDGGGFSNPRMVRVQRGHAWAYFERAGR